MTKHSTPDVAGSPASRCWAASGKSAIQSSCSFHASCEQCTEEDVCHFHLHMLRKQYERDAKPWIDRLANIKRMEIPSFVVSLPPNAAFDRPERQMSGHPKLDEAIKRGEIQQCPHCQTYWVASLHQHECVGMVRARLTEVEKQRDALAAALREAIGLWTPTSFYDAIIWHKCKATLSWYEDELTAKEKK